ncbi:hypothetical protein KUTeg_004640, partial [Tegillarca granosa]
MARLKWIYLLLWISFNSLNCVNTVGASIRSRGLKTGSFPTGYEYLTVYIIDEYNVDKIALLPKETSYVLDAGQNLPDITCTADCGTNSCTYKWKHNTRKFSNRPMLILKNVQKSETGIYECNAQDDTGNGPGRSIQLQPNKAFYEVMENSTINDVTCSADCRPGCTITWNATCMTNVLSLKQIKRDQAGVYMCTASNVAGTSINFIEIKVSHVSMKERNRKTVNYLSLGTEEGISLTVDIISHPPPNITWYFTGIDSNDLINVLALEKFVIDSEANSCLVKTYIRKDIIGGNEFGTYVLQAENVFGSVNISFVVVPHGPPDPPYQLNVVCLTSTRVMLSWKPGFNRGDEQIFYIQYRSLNEKFRRFPQIIEDDGKDNMSESLTKLQKNRLYQFTVVAVNKFGITLSKEIVNCTTKEGVKS